MRARTQTTMVCLAIGLLGCKPDEPKPAASDQADDKQPVSPGNPAEQPVTDDSATAKLPTIAGGTAIPDGVLVQASLTSLTFNDQQLVALKAGVPSVDLVKNHLILPLSDQLQTEAAKQQAAATASNREWDGRMLLGFDERLPFSTVVDIMYTAGRAEFTHYAFLIQGERALLVSPPRYGEFGPRLKVFITYDGFYVQTDHEDRDRPKLPKRDPEGTGPDAWDQQRLAELVAEFTDRNPEATTAVVSAENNIPLAVLLGTYATLAGPSCDQAKQDTCLLPDLVIEAGAG